MSSIVGAGGTGTWHLYRYSRKHGHTKFSTETTVSPSCPRTRNSTGTNVPTLVREINFYCHELILPGT